MGGMQRVHCSSGLTKRSKPIANGANCGMMKKPFTGKATFMMKWSMEDAMNVVTYHPVPCVFAASLLFFMGVEYTLLMVPPSSPPFDLGFVLTRPLHRLLASWPALNTLLAALNTVTDRDRERKCCQLQSVFTCIFIFELLVFSHGY